MVSTTRFPSWISTVKRTTGVSALFLTILALVLGASPAAQAQAYNVIPLYQFDAAGGGVQPNATLLLHGGTLYGTTQQDGSGNGGTIFSLTATGKKAGTETVLYNFVGGGDQGYSRGGVIRDTEGNLYGTTSGYGAYNGGVAWELTKAGAYNVIHDFGASGDGYYPYAGLTPGPKGVLYGTTNGGGAYSWYGTIFQLTPNGDGTYTETILYSFTGGNDGENPSYSLIRDAKGNLYGSSTRGGANSAGVIFEFTPAKGKKSSTFKVLYTFTGGNDGSQPGTLIQDKAGNLYGTASYGGANGAGTVWELSPSGGNWTLNTLYAFTGVWGQSSSDGCNPAGSGGVVMDEAGNLYGAASCGYIGGHGQSAGVIYKMVPNGDGTYTESVIYYFTGGLDGEYPDSVGILNAKGDLYGVTALGDDWTQGAVFELTPP